MQRSRLLSGLLPSAQTYQTTAAWCPFFEDPFLPQVDVGVLVSDNTVITFLLSRGVHRWSQTHLLIRKFAAVTQAA